MTCGGIGRIGGSLIGSPVTGGVGAAGAGVRVPGLYAVMLDEQREKYNSRGEVVVVRDGREIRGTWVDRDDHSAGFFLWPSRALLDQLEAGEPGDNSALAVGRPAGPAG
jgi:hypothetical protein